MLNVLDSTEQRPKTTEDIKEKLSKTKPKIRPPRQKDRTNSNTCSLFRPGIRMLPV